MVQKNKPLVSIILLNWNEDKDTMECIKSLEKIDYPLFNIIVVDNGSRKKSIQRLRKFLEKRKKVKLIEEKNNKGFTGGNNIGIREALKDKDTDYALLLNNDTTVKKDFLTKLVDFAEKKPDAGVISPFIYDYSDKSRLRKSRGKFNFWLGGGKPTKPQNRPYKTDFTSGCCWLINREVVEKTGMFKEKYFIYKEEIEWAFRINNSGYNFYVVPDSIIYHKGEQSTKKLSGFRQYYETRNSLFFVRQYGNFFQKIFFICYILSYKILKQLFMNFKSGKDVLIKNKKFFKGIKDGLLDSYD